jgi:colicin import membrane protein
VQDENGALLADGLTQPPSDHGSITPTQREDDVASEASDEITQAAQPAELEAELEERMRQVQAARLKIAAEKKRPAEAATLQQGANNAAVQQKKSGFHTAVRYESNRLQAVREDRANAAATASVREQAQINAAVRYESDALQAVELANQAHDKPNFLTPELLAKIATNKRLRHAEKAQDEASATKTMENTSELRRLDLQREEQGSQAQELAEAEREDRTKAEAAELQRANERRSQAGGEAVRQAAKKEERAEAADKEDQSEAGATKLEKEEEY